METEVRISEQMPVGESTGVDVPGQLWKRYHMEKAPIEANLNTTVEMGMSHTEGTSQNLFTYLQVALFKIFRIGYRMVLLRENSRQENTSFAESKQKILRIW